MSTQVRYKSPGPSMRTIPVKGQDQGADTVRNAKGLVTLTASSIAANVTANVAVVMQQTERQYRSKQSNSIAANRTAVSQQYCSKQSSNIAAHTAARLLQAVQQQVQPGREVEAMGTTTQLSLPMAFHMSSAVLAACTSSCLSSLASDTATSQRMIVSCISFCRDYISDTAYGCSLHKFLQ